MPEVEVDVTYLQLESEAQFRSSNVPTPEGMSLEEIGNDPARASALYRAVGDEWCWHDRLAWSAEDWSAWIESEAVRTWVARHRGVTVGYFQLSYVENAVEIAYFGLLRAFFGRGWGGWLLEQAVRQAWSDRPERVWLHTCTLDHAAALPNYVKRGFEVFDRQRHVRLVADRLPEDDGSLTA